MRVFDERQISVEKHSSHFTCISETPFGQILVEGEGSVEHSGEVMDVGDVPITNFSIKFGSSEEHVSHEGD